MSSVRKIDNSAFLISIDNYPIRIFVEVDHVEASQQTKIVEALVNNLSSEILSSRLQKINPLCVEGKEYFIKEKNNDNFLALFTSFIQKGNYKNLHKIQLVPLDETDYERQWHIDHNTAPLFAIEKQPEYLLAENRFKNLCQEGLFSDPFTSLAAHAFQNYHKDFSQKEEAQCAPSLILTLENHKEGLSFLLCHADTFKPGKYRPHQDVICLYRQQLTTLWGAKKINLLQYRYGIDFAQMIQNNSPLSVDIVYKFNIGCALLEIQDLEEMKKNISELHLQLLQSDPEAPMIEALSPIQGRMAVNYRLFTHLKEHNSNSNNPLKVKDAMDWFNNCSFFKKSTCSDLSAEEFIQLMNICHSASVEQSAKYTGRQMAGFVDSSYTYASKTNFKPWLDDHEFLECSDLLIGNYSWEYFAQQLSFVICKKHILHRHPSKEYYVGALIPAPCHENGLQEWYKVTTCMNNRAGNLSYTLEPVTDNSSLPVVKLFRSTASDVYAMDSRASIKSDLNFLNSPGYAGAKLIEPYEKQFFLERTIPLWVGHQDFASSMLKRMVNLDLETLETASLFLEQASIEWADMELELLQKPSLVDLIREYDWIILDSLQDCYKKLPYVVYVEFYITIKKYASKFNEDSIPDEDTRSDINFIIGVLKDIPTSERLALAEILENNYREIVSQKSLDTENSIYAQYTKLLVNYDTFQHLKHGGSPLSTLHAVLKDWSNEIDRMARERNESIACKRKQGILCIGHSLGGALAQRTFAKYTLLSRRIPLPGQKMELYDFDAPGINRQDNAKFIEIGNRNARLLSKWPALSIHRRQATGDFVPLGGTTHLGSTFNHEDTQAALQWLIFDAYLLEPSEQATHPGITDTPFTHGTQFILPDCKKTTDSKIQQYYKIPFDMGVQGGFSEGEEGLLNELWQLDKIVTLFMNVEKNCAWIRSALLTDVLVCLSNSLEITEDPLHGPWYKKTKPQGVLVANEEGLVTGGDTFWV